MLERGEWWTHVCQMPEALVLPGLRVFICGLEQGEGAEEKAHSHSLAMCKYIAIGS